MNVDAGTAISIITVVFAAGGAWALLRTTATRGRDQGRRIGKVEDRVAWLEGYVGRKRKPTRGFPVPPVPPDDSGPVGD